MLLFVVVVGGGGVVVVVVFERLGFYHMQQDSVNK